MARDDHAPASGSREPPLHDCLGIGFGPSNAALAIALEERGLLDRALFLEARDDFAWHPGMLIEGTDIQHNPLRDLVTPRNPTSEYGFLSYLKAEGRLFDYLNLAAPFPPRTEYARYLRWVCERLSGAVRLATPVVGIAFARRRCGAVVVEATSPTGERFHGRALSFGTGRSAHVPDEFAGHLGEDVVHLGDYLGAKARWLERCERPRVAVIGGSQSAIEIVLDLSSVARVSSISRGFGFKQKDLSPFTECIYYPEFVDYFHGAGEAAQARITNELWRSNYGAADPDVIAALNLKLYEQKVTGSDAVSVRHNTHVVGVERCPTGRTLRLTLLEKHTGERRELEVDGVVLATGYRNFGDGPSREPHHPLLEGVAAGAARRADGSVSISREYRLERTDGSSLPPIYVNGLCESSHGFGDAGSFSLLSIRSDVIAADLERRLREPSSPPADVPEALPA